MRFFQIQGTHRNYQRFAYDQWLHSDLAQSTEPVQQFPQQARKLVIAKRVLLQVLSRGSFFTSRLWFQVVSVVDISTPIYAQYRAAVNTVDDTDHTEETDSAAEQVAQCVEARR